MNDWEKCYSRNGCPYYLNHKTLKSQWEHPYFKKILSEANDYNDVIYAAYRTALKLLHIRNKLELHTLDVENIECAFNNLLPLHDVKIDEYLTLTQLDEAVYRLHGFCDTSLSQVVWTEAMSSCLLYFFDGKKKGTVNTLSVLVLLTTLSSDILVNKYSFLFQCLSHHDLVGAQDISHLKKTVFTVLARLQEDRAYKNVYEGNGTTMTKDMFVKWLLTEPKFLVWLSTLHRIHAAISVVHFTKCYRCKCSPIAGLRYRCLQCFNVDMCFQCFTRIPAYGKHDKSHAIEEYCMPSNKIQDVKAFMTKVRNNIRKKSKKSKGTEQHFDLTARRQPATLWHDPRLTDAGRCNSSPNLNAHTDLPISHTPVNSPVTERHMRQLPRTSVVDNHPTRSTHKQETAPVYPDRHFQSLPRRNKLRSTAQSSECTIQSQQSDYLYVQPVPRYNSIHQHTQPPPHYSAWMNYNSRELYAPSNRGTTTHNDTGELDFYCSTKKRVAQHPTDSVSKTHSVQKANNSNTARSATRSHYSNVYSEDEGIVVNSESDSSVSQFATYDNRDNYKVPGQCAPPTYNTYSRYDNRHEPVISRTFDYNQPSRVPIRNGYRPVSIIKAHNSDRSGTGMEVRSTQKRQLRSGTPIVIRAYQV